MLDFYLSVNNSEEVVHIPVTPSFFFCDKIHSRQKHLNQPDMAGLKL